MGSKHSVLEGRKIEYKTKPIHKIFEDGLNENSKTRAAVYWHDAHTVRETSFDNLNRNSNRLAAYILQYLHDTNAIPNYDGDYVIAVCMNTNDNVIATLLAIWKAGAAYLPLETTFPRNRITHIMGEAKPVLVIYDEYDDLSVFEGADTISFYQLLAKSSCHSEDNIHTQNSLSRNKENVAIVLYTSGSAGTPKGVRIPHTAILNKLQWLQLTFPYSASEKVGVLNSALINVDSVAELWGPLLNEVAVLVYPQEVTKDPSKLVRLLESYKVERLVLVPTLLTSILTYLPLQNQRLLSTLKTMICCGETLTTALAVEYFNYFYDDTHRLCNFYGSTEVMGDVTFYVLESIDPVADLTKVPIGYPLDNTVIFIMNDDLNPVKKGDSGEIFVAGLNLAKGYVNGREKSKFIHNRFTDNPKFDRLYRTGDFGKIMKNGCLQYEGRMDSQIKVCGNRVDMTEVEKEVRSVDVVAKGVVLCYHAGKKDQAILAFVTLKNENFALPTQRGIGIENILHTKLMEFQMPHVIIIKSVPFLPNGKIDRQTLLKIYEDSSKENDTNFDVLGVPDDQVEMAIEVFRIIGNVIGRSARAAISIKSNFYDLGGDSLNSIYTVTQLRERGFHISVTDFITASCLGEVLEKIAEGNEQGIMGESTMQLKSIPLTTHDKHVTISIIQSSFYEKSDLGAYLKEHILYEDHKDIIEQTWDYILEKDISFAIIDDENNIIGVAINFDGHDEPRILLASKLMVIFEFLESLDKPVIEKELPQGNNKVFHSFLMGTSAKLTPQENIMVIQKMEEVNMELAKRKGFSGILSTNTSPLTQQFGSDVYGYRTMVDYQINQYVHHDGTKPFEKAPNSQRVIVHWKDFTEG